MFLKVAFADGQEGIYPVNYSSAIQVYDPNEGVQASFSLTGVTALELVLEAAPVTVQGDYTGEPSPAPAVGPETGVEPAEVLVPGVSVAAGGDDPWAASDHAPVLVDAVAVEPIPSFPPESATSGPDASIEPVAEPVVEEAPAVAKKARKADAAS